MACQQYFNFKGDLEPLRGMSVLTTYEPKSPMYILMYRVDSAQRGHKSKHRKWSLHGSGSRLGLHYCSENGLWNHYEPFAGALFCSGLHWRRSSAWDFATDYQMWHNNVVKIYGLTQAITTSEYICYNPLTDTVSIDNQEELTELLGRIIEVTSGTRDELSGSLQVWFSHTWCRSIQCLAWSVHELGHGVSFPILICHPDVFFHCSGKPCYCRGRWWPTVSDAGCSKAALIPMNLTLQLSSACYEHSANLTQNFTSTKRALLQYYSLLQYTHLCHSTLTIPLLHSLDLSSSVPLHLWLYTLLILHNNTCEPPLLPSSPPLVSSHIFHFTIQCPPHQRWRRNPSSKWTCLWVTFLNSTLFISMGPLPLHSCRNCDGISWGAW